MTASMTNARDNRQSVQVFDVDLFRNKLENFMRRQSNEMCQATNTRKRKLDERWSDDDKAEIELEEDYREDLVYQFNKRPRADSYYPIDDDRMGGEEVSPLALPSPVSVLDLSSQPWPYNKVEKAEEQSNSYDEDDEDYNMRRKLSGYSEVSRISTASDNDSWMSPCPPLSRTSHSSSNSMPHTPYNGSDSDSEDFSTDLAQYSMLKAPSLEIANDLELDIDSMAPYERNLLANLAPERFEKAALIKKAFKHSEKVLEQFTRENSVVREEEDDEMVMDDGEYDQVFGELMHV